ncbi:MAG: response regulator [Pseudomonadota bacterium]
MAPHPRSQEDTSRMALSGVRILLAEDNPTNQMVAIQMLESLGASVTLAVDGAEALEIVQREDFDVMLVDIEMPRVSGIEVIRALRASSGRLAEMPLIALTAYVMREHRLAIDEAGADGVIAKPILSIEQFGEDILGFMRKRGTEPKAAMVPEAPIDVTGSAQIDQGIYEALEGAIGSEAMQELLGKVRSDIETSRTSIDQALRVMNFKALRAATHVLISVGGAIGAIRLQGLSQSVNAAGNAQDEEKIRNEGPEILAEIERVLLFVNTKLRT